MIKLEYLRDVYFSNKKYQLIFMYGGKKKSLRSGSGFLFVIDADSELDFI